VSWRPRRWAEQPKVPRAQRVEWLRRVTIIGAVRRHGRDYTLSLPKQGRHLGDIVGVTLGQHVGRDLACVGIDSEVQLAPFAARPAVLFSIPLALTEQLQTRAVQHQVDRPAILNGH